MAINVVDVCKVTPSKGAPHELTLPLQNYDIVRLPYHLLNLLFFYIFPSSQSHFLNDVVPTLTNSLSLALKHFLPLAGNIVFPLTSTPAMPFSHYVDGDSVSVSIAVSDSDFTHVTGNHSRNSDQFHGFLPLTLPHAYSPDNSAITFSPLAIQVTLLPNQGICIGHTINHAICDGGTILAFLQAWASIHKFNGDEHLVALREKFSRVYDRSGIAIANKDLATKAWNYAASYSPTISLSISLPTNKVRATFFLTDAEIQSLKSIALSKKPGMSRIASSMVILSGYLWSCLAKSAAIVGDDIVSDDETEYLTCTADIRARMNPPLPFTYFGNCTVLVLAESTHGRLKEKEGFVSAAETIGEAIRDHNKEGNVYDDVEHRKKVKGGNNNNNKRVVTIAGSPRFDMYGVDYGWGRPNKFEYPTNDCDESIFLTKPRRRGGGTEILMSMNEVKMNAFAAFFNQGLQELATESTVDMIQSSL